MITYKAVGNAIENSERKQIAVVLPVSCTKKQAREMAAYCAQQMNHEAWHKKILAERAKQGEAP